MKTRLFALLLCFLPVYLVAQNYEKEGDDLFAQAQYEKAEKKYNAAIAIVGENPTLKQKQAKCTKCKTLLTKAKTAEKDARYSDAAKYYSDIYAIHPLASYQSKANAMRQKVREIEAQKLAEEQAEKERLAREQAKKEAHTLRGWMSNNFSWDFFEGTLTIYGKGDMKNFATLREIPWYEIKDKIKLVIISSTITSIGDGAFLGCTNLTSVRMSNSLIRIGNYAFSDCKSLQTITIPKSVNEIGDGAFNRCYNLSIKIPPTFDVNLSDCKSVDYNYDYKMKEEEVEEINNAPHPISQKQSKESNSIMDQSQGENWIRLSSITKSNLAQYEFTKMRVRFDRTSSVSYCYIQIGYADTKQVALEFAFISKHPYYINRTRQNEAFTSKGQKVDNNLYEYNLNELCGTKDKKFYVKSWQDNFIPEQVEILQKPNGILKTKKAEKELLVNEQATYQGSCGNNVKWDYYDGTLTISGEGPMKDFESSTQAPWYSKRDSISSIIIRDGVTHIGTNAFAGCSNLSSVRFSVKTIGENAFINCKSLSSVKMSKDLESISSYAFAYCTKLDNFTLPNNIQIVAPGAFHSCSSLSIKVPEKMKNRINISGCKSVTYY